jgi:ribosomal protein S18 acetylase RimI-like enzyme
MNPSLRPASPADQEFLFQLYASTRQAEIAALGWSPAQQESFLRMQFQAQQRWYETAYAGAEHRIVMLDSKPAGRLLVERGAEAATLVDISLIPEYRGRGLGTMLLRDLLHGCQNSGLAVRLQVLKTNPAQRLYERVGFRRTNEDQLYFQMEWRPTPPPAQGSASQTG